MALSSVGDFDTYYSDEPFSVMDKNQRTWLDPDLIDMWRLRSVFRPILTFTRSLLDVRATSMTVSQLLDPHPDITPLAARQIWMPSMHIDSRSVEITFQHNGNKIAYHKYDDMVTYWKKNNKAGLRAIARGSLGVAEVDMNDLLARNALIAGSQTTGYNLFINDRADFSEVVVGDKFDPYIGSDIWLGMANRGLAQALGPSGAEGSIFAFTSPGVIHDIQDDDNWKGVHEYLQDRILLRYEVGAFKNVRYIQTPKCTLWNTGTILARAPVNAAVTAGDGAPNPSTTKVDGTYQVGQTTGGITNYIQLDTPTSGSMSDFAVNDIITIHATTTSAYGVTDGVDYQEGKLTNRRIVAVDEGNKRLVLDQPVLVDFDTDLGGGVYAYVTKARNIHATIFVGGPQAIVAGVAQQPLFYALDPVDDFNAIHRFSFDQYMGYQPYQPEVFEVVFSAGSTRVKGPTVVQ
jgi:hypothetical protein